MRNTVFVKTSNIERFLNGITAVEERGAAEACLLLITGKPGLGKTRAGQWWAMQQNAVYLRAKTTWTPRRAQADLYAQLGGGELNPSKSAFSQILDLIAKDPPPVILDEAEHTLHDSRVLESFRDLSDLLEFPLILIGMDAVKSKIGRLEQISSRIVKVVEFQPLTLEDVRLCCDEMAEIGVAEDLAGEIHRQCDGKIRGVLNAIRVIERFAALNGMDSAALADLHGIELVHDWTARKPQLVNGNGKGKRK